MPEMSGKCKSNPTKTNNLIYILKITQKMRKQAQKRGNLSTNWEFETFFENRKRTQKKRKRTQKKRKQTQKMREPINKLGIYNFFWKPETNPKNEETDPKKEETNQQIENLKLFLKTGNGPKKWGNGPKKRGNRSTNWEFETFFENRKRTQKKRKPINNPHNQPTSTRRQSDVVFGRADVNPTSIWSRFKVV